MNRREVAQAAGLGWPSGFFTTLSMACGVPSPDISGGWVGTHLALGRSQDRNHQPQAFTIQMAVLMP